MAKGDKTKTSDRTKLDEPSASSAASEPTEPEAPAELSECASGSAPSLDREKVDELEPPKGRALTNIIVQRYEGERLGELFHGGGVAVFQGGHVYKGSFAEGLMHGRGEHTWADGTKYEGEFVWNALMGHGSYTWLDGSTYEGEVCYGVRHGVGTYKCSTTNSVYRGQWHQCKRHGKGAILYNNEGTSWYEGQWESNHREGWGVRCYASGNIYEGQWKNNVRHGEGTMRWIQSGQQYSGQWVNGVQHGQGTHTWFLRRVPDSQYPLRNEYKGEFVQGLRHGQGTFTYASGAVYSGGWKLDKKHGQGKLILKNGCIFEGEFIDDRMVEFPAFSIDGTKTPDLSGITTHSPPPDGSDLCRRAKTYGAPASPLGPDIALSIETLLNRIPEAQRGQELRQVEFAILRHITLLREIYSLYSRLGHDGSPDNTFLLTRLQFWRFLKDSGAHLHGLTLAQIDRLVNEDAHPEEVHSPFRTMLLRNFLSNIVITSYHIYNKDMDTSSNALAECFSEFMRQNVIPNAKNVKGPLFCHPVRAVIGMNYTDRCWEIYQVFCHSISAVFSEQTMTARQFIWMLKDLGLFDDKLTAARILGVLGLENPPIYSSAYSNFDLEIHFLDFFEALLGCADMKTVHEVRTAELRQTASVEISRSEMKETPHLSQQASPQCESTMEYLDPIISPDAGSAKSLEVSLVLLDQRMDPSTLAAANTVESEMEANKEVVSCVSLTDTKQPPIITEVAEEERKEKELECWIQKTHQFFTQIFFPAYKHNILLKEEVQKERLRQITRDRIALEKAKENSRLREKWEAEEEERRRVEEENDERGDVPDNHHSSPGLVTPVASSSSVGLKQPPTSGSKKKRQ